MFSELKRSKREDRKVLLLSLTVFDSISVIPQGTHSNR